MKEPIHHDNCWECPECHTANRHSNEVLLSYPPQTPYYCMNCDYRYRHQHQFPIPEYPIGEIIVSTKERFDDSDIATDDTYDVFAEIEKVIT